MKAPLPGNEAGRLETLRQYEILDTDAEPSFDDLTRLAAYFARLPLRSSASSILTASGSNQEWERG